MLEIKSTGLLKKVMNDYFAGMKNGEKKIAWCPTFVIYEANRDLLRAANQPWFNRRGRVVTTKRDYISSRQFHEVLPQSTVGQESRR